MPIRPYRLQLQPIGTPVEPLMVSVPMGRVMTHIAIFSDAIALAQKKRMRSINPTTIWPGYEVRYPSRIHAPLEFLAQTTGRLPLLKSECVFSSS